MIIKKHIESVFYERKDPTSYLVPSLFNTNLISETNYKLIHIQTLRTIVLLQRLLG